MPTDPVRNRPDAPDPFTRSFQLSSPAAICVFDPVFEKSFIINPLTPCPHMGTPSHPTSSTGPPALAQAVKPPGMWAKSLNPSSAAISTARVERSPTAQ